MIASIDNSLQNRFMARAQEAAAQRLPADSRFEQALARTIKVVRAELGLERKELARLSGLSYPYISELEQGKKRPSAESLAAIARSLHLRQSELLERAEITAARAQAVEKVAGRAEATGRRARRAGYGQLFRLTPASAAISSADLEELASRAARLGADDFHRVLDLVRRLTR